MKAMAKHRSHSIEFKRQIAQEHQIDFLRSCTLGPLLRLAEDPRVRLYSVQVGPQSADIANMRARRLVKDMSGLIEGDWSQTAAVLRAMDCVVTTDTAVAHVAATLGVPTLMMVSCYSDWRWGDGEATPWYPMPSEIWLEFGVARSPVT
jgi:hypothetical protein